MVEVQTAAGWVPISIYSMEAAMASEVFPRDYRVNGVESGLPPYSEEFYKALEKEKMWEKLHG